MDKRSQIKVLVGKPVGKKSLERLIIEERKILEEILEQEVQVWSFG